MGIVSGTPSVKVRRADGRNAKKNRVTESIAFRYRTEAMNKKVKCANSAVKGHNDKNGKYRITFIFRQ